jgi:hypothetical protein
MQRRFANVLFIAGFLLITTSGARAQSSAAPAASPSAAAAAPGSPAAYDTFTKGATVSPGLFPIVEKNGAYYIEIEKNQLGADFIETSVPSSGLGGFGPAAGEPYVAPARIMRFERYGNSVVLRWPNTYARTAPDSPESTGVSQSLPNSVIALTPIVAQDDKRHRRVAVLG